MHFGGHFPWIGQFRGMCAHVCACVRMSDSVNSRSGIRLVWACLSLATRVANRALEGVGGLGGEQARAWTRGCGGVG